MKRPSWFGRRGATDREIEDELAAHLAMDTRARMDSGVSEKDARLAARREFGSPARFAEDARAVWRWAWLDRLRQDTAFGLRLLHKNAGFTAVVILTLALGIGANTAMFNVIYGTLLHPLPFPDPDRLVALRERGLADEPNSEFPVSPRNLLDWQAASRSFSSITGFYSGELNLGGSGPHANAERVKAARCTSPMFDTLGVQPVAGRTFTAAEDRKGGPPVAVISYSLWQSHFAGAPDVTRRLVRLDGQDYSILGVMPEGFTFPGKTTGVWLPLLQQDNTEGRGNHHLAVVARLNPGVTPAQARNEMNVIVSDILAAHPAELTGHSIALRPLAEQISDPARPRLLILLAAVGCLLLIACVNVANLLLARGAGRAQEFGIRAALGAGRRRLIAQLLIEGLLLFAGGALAGGVLAYALNRVAAHHLPSLYGDNGLGIALIPARTLGWSAMVFMFACAALAGAATSLLAAWRATRPDTFAHGAASRSATTSRRGQRLQNLLVAGQVALCTVMLIAAGLFARSLYNLQRVDAGVRLDHVITASVSLPEKSYATDPQRAAFARGLLDRLRAIPGVDSAGLADMLPLAGYWSDSVVQIEGRPSTPGHWIDPLNREASPDYFSALGIPILQGRPFTAQDSAAILAGTPHAYGAAVVSQSFATQVFPQGDAIGHVLYYGDDPGAPRFRIVGVAGDVRHGLDAAPLATVYLPILDGRSGMLSIALHTTVAPTAVVPALRRVMAELDSTLPLYNVQTMEELAGLGTDQARIAAGLLAGLAALALALASIGLYGVLSYGVQRQRKEIGVRMALGAGRVDVVGSVFFQALAPTFAGLGAGLMAAAALSRLLTNVLYGVTEHDPTTFLAVPLALAAVAVLAAFTPAWRATRVDPMAALRCE